MSLEYLAVSESKEGLQNQNDRSMSEEHRSRGGRVKAGTILATKCHSPY